MCLYYNLTIYKWDLFIGKIEYARFDDVLKSKTIIIYRILNILQMIFKYIELIRQYWTESFPIMLIWYLLKTADFIHINTR